MSGIMPVPLVVSAANTTNELTPEMKQQLEQLRDIHLPEPVSWFPMAIGWWLLIALVLIALILIYRKVSAHNRIYKHPVYLSAVDELSHIKTNSNGNSAKLAGDLSALLKRVGLYHHLPIATLSGEEWANYLTQDHTDDANKSISFNKEQANFIANGAYANYANITGEKDYVIGNDTTALRVPDWQALEATTRSWITVQFEKANSSKSASKASRKKFGKKIVGITDQENTSETREIS